MTCEGARERLPEYLLGDLVELEAHSVAAHLRGCAACRRELDSLSEGLTAFANAAHDRRPPEGLRERVATILAEEWRETPGPRLMRTRGTWIVWAAAAIIAIASIGWGVATARRSDRIEATALGYERLLETLGGEDFRAGSLEPSGSQPVEGSVLLYDSHVEQSWGLVLVRAPGFEGTAIATLEAPDGSTVELRPLEFQSDGEASTWIVTQTDMRPYSRCVIRLDDGSILATAEIGPA